jgi:hypothetical protein
MTFHLDKKAIFGDEFDVFSAPHRPLRVWLWLLVLAIVLLLLGLTAAMGQPRLRSRPRPVPSGVSTVPFAVPDPARIDPAIIAARDSGIDPGVVADRDWRIDPGIFGSDRAPIVVTQRPPTGPGGRVFLVPPAQVRRR